MATSATAPKFEDPDVKLIVASLPAGTDRQRLELLPKILREWSRTDLQEHLSREPRMIIRERNKRQKLVGKRAEELLQALHDLDDHGRFAIALEMALAPGQTMWSVSQTKLARSNKRLDGARDFLTRLAAATPRATSKQGRGQPRNIPAYLVMQDAAAIFEWVARMIATRAVDRIEHTETGPFWQFTAALWPVVFGKGDAGLASAMKNWARARNKYDERSALIANIAFRHPTWRIFEG